MLHTVACKQHTSVQIQNTRPGKITRAGTQAIFMSCHTVRFSTSDCHQLIVNKYPTGISLNKCLFYCKNTISCSI
jgi:hypothetical protein